VEGGVEGRLFQEKPIGAQRRGASGEDFKTSRTSIFDDVKTNVKTNFHILRNSTTKETQMLMPVQDLKFFLFVLVTLTGV
jgi:hypothetical protein